MLAAVFAGPGRLEMRDVAEPSCPDGGSLIAIDACAVCGTDVRIVTHGHHKVRPPQVLGHELVGRVLAGELAGQRVSLAPAVGCGDCRWCRAGRPNRCPRLETVGYYWPGAFAPLLAVPPEAVAQGSVNEVPAHLDDRVACLSEPLACCLNGQELVGTGPGDRVVIVGLGPIGCLHARLARARGATEVYLLERRPERQALAVQLGLGQLLDAAQPGAAIREATGGDGADVVILAAPVPELQSAALEWLATGGRLSWFAGLPPNSPPAAVNSNLVHYRELTVVGAHGSTPAQNRAAIALLASGEVQAADLVSGSYPLAETPAAVAAMAGGKELKSVVQVSG